MGKEGLCEEGEECHTVEAYPLSLQGERKAEGQVFSQQHLDLNHNTVSSISKGIKHLTDKTVS